MKKIAALITGGIALTVLSFSFKPVVDTSWALDKNHAKLRFTVGHLMVSDVDGWFKTFESKITCTKADFSDAVVEMTADASSINTDNEKRDADLKGAGYFDVAKYPTITFKSKSFKKVNETDYKVSGDLTIHGITKPVVLDAVCKTGVNPMSKKEIAGFKITGKIKRSDFGIGTSTPSAIIGEDVFITSNTEFTKE